VAPGEILPPWGIIVLQGAARSWMIAAIVWGSIIFVGQNVAQNVVFGNHHNNNSSYLQPTGERGAGAPLALDASPPR